MRLWKMNEELRKQIWWAIIMTFAGIMIGLLGELYTLNKEDVVVESKVDDTKELSDNQVEIDKLLKDYENPAFIKCSGYVNVRSTPSIENNSNIIGTAEDLSICEVIGEHKKADTDRKWYRVKFGEVQGYILSDYVVTDRNEVEQLVDKAKIEKIYVEKSIYEYSKAEELHANIVSIIEEGSLIGVNNYNDAWYITDDEGIKTYIKKSDSLVLQEDVYFRTIKISKTTESFLNEFSNFGITTNQNLIYVRESLDDNSKYIGAITKHTGVDIIEEADLNGVKWSKIVSGKVSGYILSENILKGDEAREYGERHAKLMAFIGDEEQDVYLDATRLSKVWTKLAKNQAYEVVDQDKYWVEVALDTGDINDVGDTRESADRAFINIENENVTLKYSIGVAIPFIELLANTDGPEIKEDIPQSSIEFRRKIVEFACKHIGNPYVWGGTSLTDGADCSGFVQSVLKEFNIYIPRVSRDQAEVGLEITSDELKPGDLIFYANSSGIVDHVAMYIGNGMIINAGSAKSGILLNVWNYRTPVKMRDVIGGRSR